MLVHCRATPHTTTANALAENFKLLRRRVAARTRTATVTNESPLTRRQRPASETRTRAATGDVGDKTDAPRECVKWSSSNMGQPSRVCHWMVARAASSQSILDTYTEVFTASSKNPRGILCKWSESFFFTVDRKASPSLALAFHDGN